MRVRDNARLGDTDELLGQKFHRGLKTRIVTVSHLQCRTVLSTAMAKKIYQLSVKRRRPQKQQNKLKMKK